MMPDIAGREVLLIDDIYDTGHTLVEIIGRLGAMKPKSICSAVLLYKEGRRQVEVEPHYVAFRIPNEFVVGYGLDYRDEYRNLPHIAALEPDEIEEG